MPSLCPKCNDPALERVRRSLVERLLFRKVLVCAKCGFRKRERRVPFEAELAFVTASHTRCIECGSVRVRRLSRRDGIDRMSAHPLSVLAGLVRAPIYHCNPCRLQYHDWRPLEPSVLREHMLQSPPTDLA
ncbi:MAG: hypothetical protein QM736_03280 [Vicinamibacterales bacterium]